MSMYESAIPVMVRKLKALSGFLAKAAAHAEAKNFDPANLVNARLAPDMFALARQIQITSDAAKGTGARLAGIDVPSWPDTETSLPELQERVEKTIEYLNSIPEAAFEGAETRDVTMKMRGESHHYKAPDYLNNLALPNFYFHLVTAYAILRHNGVDLGKSDYLA